MCLEPCFAAALVKPMTRLSYISPLPAHASPHTISFTEVELASSFSDVWQLTGGVGKSLPVWQNEMVAATLGAGPENMGAILAGLKKFCTAWQSVKADDAAGLGDAFTDFFTQAGGVMEACIPKLVEEMSNSMDGQVLESQEIYKVEAGEATFLPGLESVSPGFWNRCSSWCVNSSNAAVCKDGLVTMAETLDLKENEAITLAKQQAIHKCRKHMAQYWGCVCAEAIECLEADATTLQLRTCLHTLQDALSNAAAIVGESFPEADGFKAWAGRWVLSKLFGANILGALDQKVSEAIRSQPEIDSFLVCRNTAKLRQLCFAKQTHENAVGSLEEFQLAIGSLEKLPAEYLSQAQLSSVKAFHQKVNKVKCYSLTVHGLNMLFTRFGSKNRKERSSMLREHLGCTQESFSVTGCMLMETSICKL